MPPDDFPDIRSDSPDPINRRTSEHAAPRSVEAGPSSPRSNRQLKPITSRASEEENVRVEQAINAQRRKTSLLPGIHLHHPGQTHENKRRKRGDSIGSGSHDETTDESPEFIRRESIEGGDVGSEVNDTSNHPETDEEGEQEVELPPIPRREKIAMWKDSNIEGEDPERWTGFDEEADPNREYVWEHLYENQRGLYAFGKAYFSALALFQADPSPWTQPIKPLPKASSKFVVSKPPDETTVVHSPKYRTERPPKHRSTINTDFTPETFQLPSPDWEWMTPWQIHMLPGTDEMGWRYNAWFKMKGWRSKAGTAGWGGWVRRREWMRLRRAIPVDTSVEEDTRASDTEEQEGAKKGKGKSRSLKKVLDSETGNADEDLVAIVKEIETVRLDREKLEIWRSWLDDLDEGTKIRLQGLLEDSESRRLLYRQFMYRSTTKQLTGLLVAYDLPIPNTPSTVSKPLSRIDSRASDQASSHEGYHVKTPSIATSKDD